LIPGRTDDASAPWCPFLRVLPCGPFTRALLPDVVGEAVFLWALASGRRRGRRAALLADDTRLRLACDRSSFALRPDALFRSETRRPGVASPSGTMPALPIVGRAVPGRLLCPICALRWCLGCPESNPLRGPRSRLFLPFTDGSVGVCACHDVRLGRRHRLARIHLDPGNAGSASARGPALDVRAWAASGSAFTRVPTGDVVRAVS